MFNKRPVFMSWGFLLLIVVAASPGFGQMVLGQYEDEAPLRTWNSFAFTTAAALGRGDVSFSLASDASVMFANPALLSRLPRLSVTVNGSYQRASMFKHGIVNTGVITTRENSELEMWALDFGGASVRFGKWSIGAAVAVTEIYDRPEFDIEYFSQGSATYRFLADQTGLLRNINVSLARSFGDRLSAGIGFNYVFGRLDKNVDEDEISWGVVTSDKKSHEFSGVFLNGGATWRLSGRLTAALVFHTPYRLTAQAKSSVSLTSSRSGTDILIPGDSEDHCRRPLVIGAGLAWQASADVRLGVDLSWHNWSSYTAEFFGEPSDRNFRDIVRINVGGEYLYPFNLWGKKAALPLRIGFVLDPQPMKIPQSVYYLFTAGTGLHLDRFRLDIGVMIGKESGSGNSLTTDRIVASLTYGY